MAQAEFTSAEQVKSKRVSKKQRFLESPGVRRIKRFAGQNLGAGGIHFRRASEIEKGSQKASFLGNKAGNPSSYLPKKENEKTTST